MQFYIPMIDYGPAKLDGGPSGFEAICLPEMTRREVVELVADIRARNKYEVKFVKFVDGNFLEDVTEEIFNEADRSILQAAE